VILDYLSALSLRFNKHLLMKKFMTLSVIVLLALNASAQFQKENQVLGFGLNIGQSTNNSFSPVTTESNNGFGINVSLSLAKARSETRLNGFIVNVGYGKMVSKNSNPVFTDGFSESYNAGLGYFMRKYKPLGKNFFVFGEAQSAINYNRQIIRSIQHSDINQYQANIGIYPGLAYKWNDRFLLELRFADFANLSYSYTERKLSNTSEYNRSLSFGTSLGLGYLNNIGIGARWIIK
jgi:hypothetical protein